jgi:hypothetical protein
MAWVRSNYSYNTLLMKPIYNCIMMQTSNFIADPDLVLGEDANASSGTIFSTKEWESPELIKTVRDLRSQGLLPNLEALLLGFLKDALKAIKRFTCKYDNGGLIAELTPQCQKLSRATLINDENEGALAAANKAKRRYPTMSEEQRNALYMVKMNHTNKWDDAVVKLSAKQDEICAFSMRKARTELAENRPKRRQLEYMQQWDAQISENDAKAKKTQEARDAVAMKLGAIQLFELKADDSATLAALSALLVPKLNEQIDKLRSIDTGLIACKTSFSGTIDGVSPKDWKVKAILRALHAARDLAQATKQVEDVDEQGQDSDSDRDKDMHYTDQVF